MKNITALVEFLTNNPEKVEAVVSATTQVRMNKKDVATKTRANPYAHGLVFRRQTYRVFLNDVYEDAVNEQRVKEGSEADFETAGMRWGTPINNSILCKGEDQFYLKSIFIEAIGEVSFVDDLGNPVEYETIRPFIPHYSSSSRQGVEEEVKVRIFKEQSIQSVVIGDKVFK